MSGAGQDWSGSRPTKRHGLRLWWSIGQPFFQTTIRIHVFDCGRDSRCSAGAAPGGATEVRCHPIPTSGAPERHADQVGLDHFQVQQIAPLRRNGLHHHIGRKEQVVRSAVDAARPAPCGHRGDHRPATVRIVASAAAIAGSLPAMAAIAVPLPCGCT